MPIASLRSLARGAPCAVLLVVASICWSASARADRFHYQSVLIGQRAIGIGGAFTGLADDPSATFYNPGGLAQIPKDGLSLSLSVNAFDKRTIKDAVVTDVGTQDLVHKGRPSVPVSATMMVKLGPKDSAGFRSHAVAFSTFTRDRDDYDYRATLVDQLPDDPTRRRAVEAKLQAKRSELWYGPSYAYRVSPRWYLGVSAFFSVLRLKMDTQTTVTEGDAVRAVATTGEPFSNPTFRQQLRSLDATTYRMLFRIGALYKPLPKLSFGLMFQTPTIPIKAKGKLTDRIITLSGPENVGTFTQVKRDVSAPTPDSWELRAGVSYHPLPRLHFSLDGSVHGPSGSKSRPLQTLHIHESDDPDDIEPTLGSFFMQSWYRRTIGNLSLGVMAEAERFLDVAAGFFTDFSSAPHIQASAAAYSEPDVNHLGATAACAFHKDRYNVSVGFVALWGSGDGYAFHVNAPAGEPSFSRTTVTDRTFMLFVYGYSRALQRAAEDSYNAIKKRREAQEAAPAELDE